MWLHLFAATFCAVACYVAFRILDYLYRKSFLDDFASKSVFVTGTDTGFGRLLALKLDRRGVKVYAGCYTSEGAESLSQESSSRLRIIRIDVSDRDSIQRAKDEIEKDLGPEKSLWGVVNNAGMAQGPVFPLMDIDDYRRVMEVNFFGPVNVCQIFLPLIQRARGRVVNVCSVLGRISGFVENYTISKHALEVYTDGLRIWSNVYDIHVATIEPGWFPTRITSIDTLNTDLERSWNKCTPARKEELGGDKYLRAASGDITEAEKPFQYLKRLNNIALVPNAIIHALGAKHPRHRYCVGWDARMWIFMVSIVPDWLMVIVVNIAMWRQTAVLRKLAKATKSD